MRLVNEFSWSFSRANTYLECPKRYWYIYYGSWEGWLKEDPLATYLYAMKQMQNLPTFIGSIVHETIEHFLKTKKAFQLEPLLEDAKKCFKKGIEEAKSGQWKKAPKKHKNLFEFYYNQPPTEDQLLLAEQKVTLALSNWFQSPIVQKLAFHPDSRWLSIEELASFQLQGYKIIVVIDFAMMWQNTAVLFDWKTGEESEKTGEQLYCYALFANKVWAIPFDKIILSPFYVSKNSYSKLPVVENPEKELAIVESCKRLSALHELKDPRLFAYTEDRKNCARCPFRQICQAADYQDLGRDELAKKIN